jgi:hypothetical protein
VKDLGAKKSAKKSRLNGRALIEVIPARMRIIMLGASSQDFVYDAVKLRVPREQRKSRTETTEDLTQHGECNVRLPCPNPDAVSRLTAVACDFDSRIVA